MSSMDDRFFKVVMGFQHFAGKPLRVTDHAKAITPEQMTTLEQVLRNVATSLRTESIDKWKECHRLADQIEASLNL